MIIVIVGNVVDGLEFYGPFESADEAIAYAENRYEEWTLCNLTDPYNNTML